MPLMLRPNKEGPPDDYHVWHGGLLVGQIYMRDAAQRSETQWLWALNGVPGGPAGLLFAGLTGTRDEALAHMKESWQKWLAWARFSQTAE